MTLLRQHVVVIPATCQATFAFLVLGGHEKDVCLDRGTLSLL